MRALLLASVAILGIVWSECASASLLGDTFNETANLTFGKTTEVVANNGNSKVNPTATFYGQPNQITTTISATGISLVSGSVTTTFSAYTFNGFVLTDLTNSDISGVTLLSSSVPGFTANDLTATSDTISVNLAGLIVGGERVHRRGRVHEHLHRRP